MYTIPQSPTKSSVRQSYSPYRRTAISVVPMLYMILEPCLQPLAPLLTQIGRIRWTIAHPLNTRIVPTRVRSVPTYLKYITIGEILISAPLVFLSASGYNESFVRGNLEESGRLASYALYLTFLTANKTNSLISLLFGVSFERLIPLHVLSSCVAIMLGCFHTYTAFVYGSASRYVEDSRFASFGVDPDLEKFLFDGRTNTSGSLLILTMILSVTISILPIRRVLFNFWFASHLLLALIAITACLLHNVTTIVFVVLWWILDWIVRYVAMASLAYQVNAQVYLLDSGETKRPIVELRFPKPAGFNYSPGQFVQIALPALSSSEFHPFTISSAPHEPTMSLKIRGGRGDWTRKLVRLARSKNQSWVMIEGPYGAVTIDLEDPNRYRTILMVSGGIGITHTESLGKALIYNHGRGRPLTHLRYVWAVRSLEMTNQIPPLGGRNFLDEDSFSEELIAFRAESTPGLAVCGGITSEIPSTPFGFRFSRRKSQLLERSSQGIQVADEPSDMESDELEMDEYNIDSHKKVQIDVHCTRDDGVANLKDGDMMLNVRIHRTRPNFHTICSELKKIAAANGESNIGVVCCGHQSLIDDVREACRLYSSNAIGCGDGDAVFFDIHTEKYEF